MGYHDAGFEVEGVDIAPQPNYPFKFYELNAIFVLETLATAVRMGAPIRYSAIHTSPPCQSSSNMTKGTNAHLADRYTDLIPQTRELLDQIGLPYVIENVQGSALRRDLTLCGEQFGLRTIRHRYFELGGFSATVMAHLKHKGKTAGWRHGVNPDEPYYFAIYGTGGSRGTLAQWKETMDCPWMGTKREVAESIPRHYTRYIGKYLLEATHDRLEQVSAGSAYDGRLSA